MPCLELQSWKSHEVSAVVWKNISHIRTRWLPYCRSLSKPWVMKSAERNPKVLGGCSRTCLRMHQLHVIFTAKSLGDTTVLGVLLSSAKQVVVFIGLMVFLQVLWLHSAEKLHPTWSSFPSHFISMQNFSLLPGTGFWCCFVLLNSWSVLPLSGPPSTLGKKPESEEGTVFTQCEASLSSFEFAGVSYRGLSENLWTYIAPFSLLFF